ncbi:MAG: hypothetical protein AB8B78_04360 [Polaribacter sp.]
MKFNYIILFSFLLLSCATKKQVVADYTFVNSNNNYNKIIGDFKNINYKDSNYNFMVKYLKKINNQFRVIVVLISEEKNSKQPLITKTISVSSKKFGVFKSTKQKRSMNTYDYKYFFKKIKRQKDNELINYLKNDTITISINNEKFLFTSPTSYVKFQP